MLCCGPLPFRARVEHPAEAVTRFADDGTLIGPAP
jgi:hypothetical protein